MSEELKSMEETAPITEKEPTEQQLKAMRRNYVENRKKEVEILELDTRFLELQIKHYEFSMKVKEINDKIKAEREAKEFAAKLGVEK